MIAFDLECTQGHVFEGWFDSLESFEDQNEKDLIRCPFCEDAHIRRVLSPVALKKTRHNPNATPSAIDYQRLAKEIVDYVHSNFEDVGSNFASEAYKMHYDVTEKRNIRGTATTEEENSLKEEGIQFFKFPLPNKDKDQKH
jgi:hypothetical protein